MSEDRTRSRWTAKLAALVITLPLAYVLSHAPVVKWRAATGRDTEYIPYYGPIERLETYAVDNHGALVEVLAFWARIWGVDDEILRDASFRLAESKSGNRELFPEPE